MIARLEYDLGDLTITGQVFAYLVGYVATTCFGVVGMASIAKPGDIVKLLKKDSLDKGVNVKLVDGKLDIDLHIVVEYGVNIPAISKSIINRVKYYIESTTGFNINNINVFVDAVRID